VNQAPQRAIQFNPNVSDGGSYPPPMYPGVAQRNHYEGTVIIEFTVDEAGKISEAKVSKSSGYSVLDEAALNVVKQRWRFPPGKPHLYQWPCVFQF
jgi:protein TonB